MIKIFAIHDHFNLLLSIFPSNDLVPLNNAVELIYTILDFRYIFNIFYVNFTSSFISLIAQSTNN